MKGPGGLQLGELGQRAQKISNAVASNFVKPNVQSAARQITGKQFGTSAQQPKASEAMGDFGKALEQNQTQQQPSGNPVQQPASRPDRTAEFQQQRQEDQAKIAATRSALQELEAEMKKIKQEREQKWEEQNQQEEQEKKMEELQQEEQQKQQPVRAGSPNPEGGKMKG